jgi:hypothetical protein
MAGIFLNYRREDTSGHALLLHGHLVQHFGKDQVFMDLDKIVPGADFVEVIEHALNSTEVMLVLIGKQWLTVTDRRQRRRLDNPSDYVRLEVASALRRKDVRVIPVLLQEAETPDADELPDELMPLTRRQAVEIRDGRWNDDVAVLVKTLEQTILTVSRAEAAPAQSAEFSPVQPAALSPVHPSGRPDEAREARSASDAGASPANRSPVGRNSGHVDEPAVRPRDESGDRRHAASPSSADSPQAGRPASEGKPLPPPPTPVLKISGPVRASGPPIWLFVVAVVLVLAFVIYLVSANLQGVGTPSPSAPAPTVAPAKPTEAPAKPSWNPSWTPVPQR